MRVFYIARLKRPPTTLLRNLKMKFRDKLKSKNRIAQENELLCKLITHNIVVLIQEMFELGIDPGFL